MSDDLEFEVYMSDDVLNESDGHYSNINRIFYRENPNLINKKGKLEWFLRSNIGILNQFGYNEFVCQFDNEKNVYIVNYTPVIKDIFYNMDIRCFNQWLSSRGWGLPEPKESIINERFDFWKYQWETNLIKSDYFQKIFKRNDDGENDNIEITNNL